MKWWKDGTGSLSVGKAMQNWPKPLTGISKVTCTLDWRPVEVRSVTELLESTPGARSHGSRRRSITGWIKIRKTKHLWSAVHRPSRWIAIRFNRRQPQRFAKNRHGYSTADVGCLQHKSSADRSEGKICSRRIGHAHFTGRAICNAVGFHRGPCAFAGALGFRTGCDGNGDYQFGPGICGSGALRSHDS